MDIYTIFAFALHDSQQNKFVSYDPVSDRYFPVDGPHLLQIWDVWDREMIPYIKTDKMVSDIYTVHQLERGQIEKLPFLKSKEI